MLDNPRKRRKFQTMQSADRETILSLPLSSQCLVVHPVRYAGAKMFFTLAINGARGHFFPGNRMLGYARDLHFLGLFPIVKPRLPATCSTWLVGSSHIASRSLLLRLI